MRKTLRLFCFVALAALMLAPFGSTARAKERPENDCLIGIVDADGKQLSGDVTCTDCDPTCDNDGVASANGSCQFGVQACLNIAATGCTQRPLRKVKIKTQFRRNEISVTPVTGSTSSVCGAFVNSFQVNLKKRGKKKGTRNVIAIAQADVKPRGRNKDRDHVRFICLPRPAGEPCPTTTTSTTIAAVTTTSTTTSTTVPTCGDGAVNGTEACDPAAATTGCAQGETCMPAGALSACTCKTCTTPTQDKLTFTTGIDVASDCGDAGLVNLPVGPTCGKIIADDMSEVPLGCGCLYIGGGNSTVPGGATPDGSSSELDITGTCGSELLLGPSTQAGAVGGQNACTTGPGPGKACINDVTKLPDINALQSCTTDDDCPKTGAGNTTALGSCVDKPNCFFGPPLPIKNGTLSTCVLNTFGGDAGGSVNPTTGEAGVSYPLRSHTFLTGNGASPCPTCVAGTCTAGARSGMACSNPVGTTMVTPECPPGAAGGAYLPEFNVTLSPLTTNLGKKQNAGGIFCPNQQTKSAFGTQAAITKRNIVEIQETGVPAGDITDGMAHPSTLGAVFCIPATGNGLIDGAADLAGPGAVSLPGTVQMQ